MKWPLQLKRALAHAFVRRYSGRFVGKYSFAAVLVTSDTTIVRHNVTVGVPQPTKHAEMRCLDAHGNTNGAIMYVARSNRHGDALNSRPCVNCERAIRLAGIKSVTYTNEDGSYSKITFY